MGIQEDLDEKVIQHISDKNLIGDLSPGRKQDVLSIVFDALNSVIGGVIITDLHGIVCFANPSFCKMFGYIQEDIIGKNAVELFTTKEIRKLNDIISILDTSKNKTEEFIVQKSGGGNRIIKRLKIIE